MTKNLSSGGLFLLTERRYADGDVLRLALEHKGLQLTTSARVTHAQADGVGVRFWNPSDEFRQNLAAIIEDFVSASTPFDDTDAPGELTAGDKILWRVGTLEYEGVLADISMEGAFIVSNEQPPIGGDVYVLLPYLDPMMSKEPEIVGCAARVTRSTPEGFGVGFVSPSAEFAVAVAHVLGEMILRR